MGHRPLGRLESIAEEVGSFRYFSKEAAVRFTVRAWFCSEFLHALSAQSKLYPFFPSFSSIGGRNSSSPVLEIKVLADNKDLQGGCCHGYLSNTGLLITPASFVSSRLANKEEKRGKKPWQQVALLNGVKSVSRSRLA